MASGSTGSMLLRDSAAFELLQQAEIGGGEEQQLIRQSTFPRCHPDRALERGGGWSAEQEEWQSSRLAWAQHLLSSHESSESGGTEGARSSSPEESELREALVSQGSPFTVHWIMFLLVLAPVSLAFLLAETLVWCWPTRTVHEYVAVASISGAVLAAIFARVLALREMQKLQAVLADDTGPPPPDSRSSWLQFPTEDANQRLLAAKRVFARFLPHQVVDGIMAGSIDTVQVHNRTVTTMFCDIRGYTALCRELDSETLLQFLQRYLTVMCRVVILFKGTIAEIQGDGILAFWNADSDVEEHATRACAAAVAMQQAVVCLNEEWRQLRVPQLSTGIAIHTGQGLTGIIGCREKLKWGCLGDVVNLTSRLEALCKHYGVGIICTSATQELLASRFSIQPLDKVELRGISQAMMIYHVSGLADQVPAVDSSASVNGVEALYRQAQEMGVRLSFDDEGPWPFTWNVAQDREEELLLYAAGLACFQEGHFDSALAITHAILNQRRQANNVAAHLAERAAAMVDRQRSGRISPEEREQWSGSRVFT